MSVISELEKLQRILKNHLVKMGHFRSIEEVEQELLKNEYQLLASNIFKSSKVSDHYKNFVDSLKKIEKPNLEVEDVNLVEKFKNLTNYI
ncbi:hypothetical protein EHEL_060685 [Encephalitozoon hellem ATCC 50504]|uniref:Uncharacterized protein n=1 Tax=Encephalitozoon hellem TaxID=27973 RepID=A0A9Q9C4B9_ENCHE|nr:uncharacterized protein EHEL_060685 [Encephalitozoon hellem ATCC 50504]AHL28942.1 hypothetical protein EHEL_060685 [Encephalitozoon hellem ATCC 50504]UTX43365.1 hypothetical protein GPU96_06g11120 [Encephalitozoon hellem]